MPLRKSRDSQNAFGNACNSVANARKFFVGLATVLQTLKSFSKHLQQRCKHQKVFQSTCSVSAKTKKFFGALAAFLQTPKSSPRRLRKFRKRQKALRSTCGSSANAKKLSETLAEVPQTPKSSPRRLRKFRKRPSPGARRLMLSSNSRIEEAEAVCDGGYLWRRFQTMKDEKMDYGCDDRVCDGGKRTGV